MKDELVERYAEISECTWDPSHNKWQIHGQLILQYDEHNYNEYEFVLEDSEGGYQIVRELSGSIPDYERHWLKEWAKTRQNQLNGGL
ncbi:MAG: hypothetical protein GX316_07880 [Firmicutes bacterium]|nr:hypothetical protein [Bacillota bacterium]